MDIINNNEPYHPVVNKLIELLKKNNIWYTTFTHAPVTTSQEAALTRPGYTLNQGAKALIVKIEKKDRNNEYTMLVLPANLKLDSKKVKQKLNLRGFRFASEDEISILTGNVKRGAIPPFGTIFNLKVFSDPLLYENEKIVFNAGDRRFSIAIKSEDFKKLVQPSIFDMASESD